ncbi:YqzL family protein [Peribacillus psychrosaccharolyticus]|uniref:YqzL family protein n=1 Tax=Peribacillus psychrosaccharolyticus TaxID=1407 RepID=A0A974S169_PERPY|nr:YqzL family protein [Peribacillus psychrosaccharolyticus]MEC2054323.1 YqzL family protein [Peribacillus psychrosaccharolyticus]MED3744449.1 YqzL family protein [Peribacillus psychrosaccharolyticus]QQS99919.1 YqzL family protein [Peribacillus psychrosaccharolyticus]
MLNFTWNVFSQTGNLDTYLLYKEIEVEGQDKPDTDEDLALMDSIS